MSKRIITKKQVDQLKRDLGKAQELKTHLNQAVVKSCDLYGEKFHLTRKIANLSARVRSDIE